MKGIDKNFIRECFDELKIATRLDDDGDMVVVQNADSDFAHDVVIFVIVSNNRLSYIAAAPDFKPEGDLLVMCNKHNCTRVMPTAVVREGELRMETSFLLDEEVSREFITENCVKMPLAFIWRAFCDFGKE